MESDAADYEISYPALRITTGPDEGRRIALTTGIPDTFSSLGQGPVQVGSQVPGLGQLSAPGVAPHHADFHCIEPNEDNRWSYEVGVDPVDGELVINGGPSPVGDVLKPGDDVLLGECRIVMEMVNGFPPARQAFNEALEQAAAGSAPFRFIVQSKPHGGEKTIGLLAAGQGRLALTDPAGHAVFEVALAELQDVSFPRHRSNVIELTARGTKYKIWLVEEIWIPSRGDPSYAGDAGEVETASPLDYFVVMDILNQINKRTDRGRWKKILTGETQAEEISQEVARDRLVFVGT